MADFTPKNTSRDGAESSSGANARRKPTRRSVLRAGATGAIVGSAGIVASKAAAQPVPSSALLGANTVSPRQAESDHAVFQHGVASGDPLPNAVIIWTRVTSHPADIPGDGVGEPIALRWEVSPAEDFIETTASGEVTSNPDNDNTVHVDVTGLDADRWYYYRFTVLSDNYAGQQSPVGRTRTTPPAGASPEHLGIALTSCANYESGYFSAYADMATNPNIDIVMCVGDYIYEYGVNEYAGKLGPIREHQPPHETITLQDYRRRYGTYRTDADLQAAHAAKPWMVTWDDHEVANDNWAEGAENHQPEEGEGDFIARRDAAMRAYIEWLPIRTVHLSEGGKIYRHFQYGDLADIVMLDLRTYRDRKLEFREIGQLDNPDRSMLGSEQFNYLKDKWASSTALWNLVGNSVMFTPVLIPPLDPQATAAITELMGLPEEGMPYNLDQWDGYPADRRRLIQTITEMGLDNIVFLTGDIHSSWACNVPVAAGRYPRDGIAAVELVCTSVSAPNIDDIVYLPQRNPITIAAETGLTTANRHVKWIEFDHHGYAAIYVGRDEITAEYRWVEDKAIPNQPLYVAKTYKVQRGIGVLEV